MTRVVMVVSAVCDDEIWVGDGIDVDCRRVVVPIEEAGTFEVVLPDGTVTFGPALARKLTGN